MNTMYFSKISCMIGAACLAFLAGRAYVRYMKELWEQDDIIQLKKFAPELYVSLYGADTL
ncbi:MAG: hypothetical protein VZR23_07395 [Lachnospiraceae bacterium]|nr:hypothetical protein [Lachnospiraceae bacterium]